LEGAAPESSETKVATYGSLERRTIGCVKGGLFHGT
jgi:hypothetical protein